MQRLTFFGGKGGVGKTTCAAAAAVRAAAEGARVLVVSTDPAHSLADALQAPLGASPSRVALRGGALFAAQLDADRALSRWLRDRREAFETIARRGTYLDDEDIERLFTLSLPGVDELVGLLELVRLAASRDYDEVVVDTAPTGHTLRLLAMPATLRRFAEVLDGMHDKHRFLAASLAGRWRGDFADEVIAEVERSAVDLSDRLADASRTSLTWVTLPEELSVDEALEGIAAARSLAAPVSTIVVNRVWPSPGRWCPRCSPRVAKEDEVLARIARGRGSARLLTAPALAEEPRGVVALERFAAQVSTSRARLVARGRAVASSSSSRPAPSSDAPPRPDPIDRGVAALGLPPGVRLVVVVGKGGVGKTSVATSIALGLSASRRTLLLSTDPAHSLGHLLGARVGDDEVAVAGAPDLLRARELDARAAFDRERTRYRRAVDELFASLFRGNLDARYDRQVLNDLIDLAPPGLDELFAVVETAAALDEREEREDTEREDGARDQRHEVIVMDTAPTGHALRLLDLPGSALAWVHALMAVILKYRRVIGLGELAADLTRLARRLRALSALLVSPDRVAFVVVSRPAALPRLETDRLVRALRRRRMPVAAVVVNAVSEPSCARCTVAADSERPEIEALSAIVARERRGDAERGAVAPRLVLAPAVYPPPRKGAALSAWCRGWTARIVPRSRRRSTARPRRR